MFGIEGKKWNGLEAVMLDAAVDLLIGIPYRASMTSYCFREESQ
jgi:hypothetical protein